MTPAPPGQKPAGEPPRCAPPSMLCTSTPAGNPRAAPLALRPRHPARTRRLLEASKLALHLLQSALAHVSTLLLQQVLADPVRAWKLSDEDRRGLTALFWSNINPYGTFRLEMDKRLDLGVAHRASPPAGAGRGRCHQLPRLTRKLVTWRGRRFLRRSCQVPVASRQPHVRGAPRSWEPLTHLWAAFILKA
ncbi:Tn3 family transposase [Streptomyces sp. NPDC000410]|uniref:Tn3 family transposase n=1 Tax=Streptomyces sp. NPDC000410 TaxID=3154254 RepID=UPI0033285980